MLLSKDTSSSTFAQIALSQPRTAKKVLHALLSHISSRFLGHVSLNNTHPDDAVSAVAGILQALVLEDEIRKRLLITWCTSSSGAGLGDGIGIRRAVLAALAQDRGAITTVLEESLAQFGDELYIKHAAMLQQDGIVSWVNFVRIGEES